MRLGRNRLQIFLILSAGMGLDPSAKARRKVLKKARKLAKGKRKKKRSTSGSSSSGSAVTSSSSSSKDVTGGLFKSERRMRPTWRRYPGALAATSLVEAPIYQAASSSWDVPSNAPRCCHGGGLFGRAFDGESGMDR